MLKPAKSLIAVRFRRDLYTIAEKIKDINPEEWIEGENEEVFYPVFEASLEFISHSLDRTGDHDPERDFGRILTVAKHCLAVCTDETGAGIITYPQIAEPKQAIVTTGLLLNLCSGPALGFNENLPNPTIGSWNDGIYMHLAKDQQQVEPAAEMGTGVYVPILHAHLFNPNPAFLS